MTEPLDYDDDRPEDDPTGWDDDGWEPTEWLAAFAPTDATLEELRARGRRIRPIRDIDTGGLT